MFYDDTPVSDGISMENIHIDIISGTVYRSSHLVTTNINIKNISIQTDQLTTDDTEAIFVFESADIVDIINITILYIYDMSLHCQYDRTTSNSIIKGKCMIYSCKNAITFIRNFGMINIDGIKINMNRFGQQIQSTYAYKKCFDIACKRSNLRFKDLYEGSDYDALEMHLLQIMEL